LVVGPALRDRLGLRPDDPRLATYEKRQAGRPQCLDIHAGEAETSVLLAECCDLCRRSLIPGLAPTNLTAEDLTVWRRGGLHARKVTPLGYFGDPAAATPGKGRDMVGQDAVLVAEAVERTLRQAAGPGHGAGGG
jgi:creatinine amidohydrolase